MKKWNIRDLKPHSALESDAIITTLLKNRGITSLGPKESFFCPKNPLDLTPKDVGISADSLKKILHRIQRAIEKKESMVVYADYDADGITAGAILWETIYGLGGKVMPYIPDRKEEGTRGQQADLLFHTGYWRITEIPISHRQET